MESGIEEKCSDMRGQIRDVAGVVKDLMKHSDVEGQPDPEAQSEERANIMLAYRHLEDARMRLGKVMQAHQGGVSIFDRQESQG